MRFNSSLTSFFLMCSVVCFNRSMTNYAVEYEQEWAKKWGGEESDIFHSAIETSDGKLVVVAESDSTNVNSINYATKNAVILKMNKDGDQEWQNSWGGNSGDYFEDIAELKGGDLVAAGFSYSTDTGVINTGQSNAIIVKYDQEGVCQWAKSWGGNGTDTFKSVAATSDGGFVVVGSSRSTNLELANQGGFDAIIVKYDQEGNQEWFRSFAQSGIDVFNSVIEVSDGGIVAVGRTQSSTNSNDALMVKYSQTGEQEWVQRLERSSNEEWHSLVETPEGDLIVAGGSRSIISASTVTDSDILLARYQSNGSELWQKTWGGSGDESAYGIVLTLDGEFIVTGSTDSIDLNWTNQGVEDSFLVQFDSNGNETWRSFWGEEPGEFLDSMLVDSNGDLFILGSQLSYDSWTSDAILLKYTPKKDTNLEISGEIDPLIASITIPVSDLTFVINPNQPIEQSFIAPEFSLINDSKAPLTLTLKSFEQRSDVLKDVLPDKHTDWTLLGTQESKEFALALKATDETQWLELIQEERYVVETNNALLGVLKPQSTVEFAFEAKHGLSFTETITPTYRLSFVFDLR